MAKLYKGTIQYNKNISPSLTKKKSLLEVWSCKSCLVGLGETLLKFGEEVGFNEQLKPGENLQLAEGGIKRTYDMTKQKEG